MAGQDGGKGAGADPVGGRKPGRVGRPTLDRAGEIEGRILDAALEAFLAHGFDATRTERVVLAAGAGKASFYARFENKEALFSAVIEREIARAMRGAATAPSPGSWPESWSERLTRTCSAVVETSLTPEAVALMRLMIGTAARFPDLATRIDAAGRRQAVARIAQAVAEAPGQPGSGALAVPAAEELLDLVFAPLQLRALLGADLAALRREVEPKARAAIALLTGPRPPRR